jgi:hypothetical protein
MLIVDEQSMGQINCYCARDFKNDYYPTLDIKKDCYRTLDFESGCLRAIALVCSLIMSGCVGVAHANG